MEHSGLKIVKCVNGKNTILVEKGEIYSVDRQYLNKSELKYDLTNMNNKGVTVCGVSRNRFVELTNHKPILKRYNKSVYFPMNHKDLLVHFSVLINSIKFGCNRATIKYKNNWWKDLQKVVIDTANIKKFIGSNLVFFYYDIVEYYTDENDTVIRAYYKVKYTDIMSMVIGINNKSEVISVEVNNYDEYSRFSKDKYCKSLKQLEYTPRKDDGFIEISKTNNKLCSKDCQFYLKCWRHCELFKKDLKDVSLDSARCADCLNYIG